MATVTVVTAERTLEIEATSIVDGSINAAGHLILERHDGTPIDMGAVSGMQMNSGSGYSKVDAFSYIGPSDPGAVPNGSVWYDTTDVAGPVASDTQKGLVELATPAETIAGTDTLRAVTPAGLAALPGYRVQILANNANTETALPSAYPSGMSLMSITTGSGWSINAGFGSVFTQKSETDRTVQIAYSNPGGTGTPRSWIRQYHSSNNGGGWTSWSQYNTVYTLAPGSVVQSSSLASYPNGWSRIYFSTANSTGWDFAGSAGELLTYTEGSDYAKQTWTSHVGGSGIPEMWVRTSNAANGWTAWRKFISDPGGWTPYTPTWTTQTGVNTPSLGNATVSCSYIKLGRKVDVRFEINFGSTTTFGSSPTTGDNWQFSLPVAAARSSDSLGFVELSLSNSAIMMARARAYSTTGFRLGIVGGRPDAVAVNNTGDVDSISPWVWTTAGSLKGHLTYESAS